MSEKIKKIKHKIEVLIPFIEITEADTIELIIDILYELKNSIKIDVSKLATVFNPVKLENLGKLLVYNNEGQYIIDPFNRDFIKMILRKREVNKQIKEKWS